MLVGESDIGEALLPLATGALVLGGMVVLATGAIVVPWLLFGANDKGEAVLPLETGLLLLGDAVSGTGAPVGEIEMGSPAGCGEVSVGETASPVRVGDAVGDPDSHVGSSMNTVGDIFVGNEDDGLAVEDDGDEKGGVGPIAGADGSAVIVGDAVIVGSMEIVGSYVGLSSVRCEREVFVGLSVGMAIGRRVGDVVGMEDGRRVGIAVGGTVGLALGVIVRGRVGAREGWIDGREVGGRIGFSVG
jgi:hypothetical protein